MGTQFSRAPLLRPFRHLPSVPAKHVTAAKEVYVKELGSPPFVTRDEFLCIFYADLVTDAEAMRGKKKDRKKEEETIRADLQFQLLDRRAQGRVSALDIFAGLALLCHDSMENRLRFVFKMVDFTRNGALNMAELILLFGSSLRGIARMKGIFPDAPYWHSERLAREVFRKAGVHFRAGEGVGDYADGGVTVTDLIEWARDDGAARRLLDNVDFGAYLSQLMTRQEVLWTDLIDVRAAIQLKRGMRRDHNSTQDQMRSTVRDLRTTDPGNFQLPQGEAVAAAACLAIPDTAKQPNGKVRRNHAGKKKKAKKKGLVLPKKDGTNVSKISQTRDSMPVWDRVPHTLDEKMKARALALKIYRLHGVLSERDQITENIMRRMRLRGMALENHKKSQKGAIKGSGMAVLVTGAQEIADESDEEREEEERARLALAKKAANRDSGERDNQEPEPEPLYYFAFLGEEPDFDERRWWVTVDQMEYIILGMVGLVHFSLSDLQTCVRQLAGPMPPTDEQITFLEVEAKERAERTAKMKELVGEEGAEIRDKGGDGSSAEAKSAGNPNLGRKRKPEKSKERKNKVEIDNDTDEPDEDEKIYFPRFLSWLIGEDPSGKCSGRSVNEGGEEKKATVVSRFAQGYGQDDENSSVAQVGVGRLRESLFKEAQRRHLQLNASITRSMQREQMYFLRKTLREKKLLDLTIAREQDEEDERARLAQEMEMMEGEAREAMAASMAASMARAEDGMTAAEVASSRAKKRWMKLRVMDAESSGYLEASTVRGLQAMLSGENVDGAIDAANMVTPRSQKKKKKKNNDSGSHDATRPGSRGSAAASSWSRPSSRGSSSYASTGFDSRPGSRGAGSRPNSRNNRRRPGSRGASRSRPSTGNKRKGGWASADLGTIADRWQFGGVADHRFDEAQARHKRLVKAVEQAGSDSEVEEDEMITDAHAEAKMSAAQRRRKWRHGSAKDDILIGPHLNYERPIPWFETFNSIKMWFKRNSQNLMRRLLSHRRAHRWFRRSIARAAYRQQLASEADNGQKQTQIVRQNMPVGDFSEVTELIVKGRDPLVAAVSMPPEELPVGGRGSLAGEDRLCGERLMTIKVEIENPGEKNRVPYFDPVPSDEDDDEEDEDEEGDKFASRMSPPYTARTDSTFASTMTGMTTQTGMTGIVSFGGNGEAEIGQDEADDQSDSDLDSDDSLDDTDSDDETKVELPEKPAIILDFQLACKHPHSQQVLDRQGQLLRSSEGPDPPLWLEALKQQHEKALKRKKTMQKRLMQEREAKAEADALEAAREKARNRFSQAKAAAARGEPIPKHSPSKAKKVSKPLNNNKKEDDGSNHENSQDNDGEEDDNSEDDEDTEFGESGADMDCTTEDLAAICFEFSCKEGVKDSASTANGLTISSSNTATQAATAGMTASRGAASAAAGLGMTADGTPSSANASRVANISATEMLERLKEIADTLSNLLQNPLVEEMYNEFAFHPDVRVTRSMGILCIRVSFSLRPEADLFHAIPRALGLTKDAMFSSRLGSGVPGAGGGKSKDMSKGKYVGGGMSLFESRVEMNCDIFDGIRLTAPFVDHHSNMVRWELPKSDKRQHGLQSMMAAKLAASKFKKKAQQLVSTKEESEVNAAKKALAAMQADSKPSNLSPKASDSVIGLTAGENVDDEQKKFNNNDDKNPQEMHHGLEFSPVLTFMGERMVECIFQRFDKDEDGVLSFSEINSLAEVTGVPQFSYPSEYADVILEEGFDYKKCNLPPQKVIKNKPEAAHVAANAISSGRRGRARIDYGIGLTLAGLKQAYAKGEGDLGRDVAVLGLGSLSHYLRMSIIVKTQFTSSLGRLLARPMASAAVPGWYLGTGKTSWKQQLIGYAARLTKTFKPEYYFPEGFGAFLASLPWGLACERAIRKKDGSATTKTVREWIAWFFGQPGAVAQLVYSIRQNLETLTERWRGEVGYESRPSTSASTNAGLRSRPSSRNNNVRRPDTGSTVQEDLDEQERAAAIEDEMKAKRNVIRLRSLCEGTVEELICAVVISGKHSLRLTCSGVDIHRLFFDDMEAEAVRRKAARMQAKEELMEKMRKRKYGH